MAQSGTAFPLNQLKGNSLPKGFIVYFLNKLFSDTSRKKQGQFQQIYATVISLAIVLIVSVILYYSLSVVI